MGYRRGKLINFQKKGLGLFRPFISTVFGWPASFLFDSPSELDNEPSHGWSGVNWGEVAVGLVGFF